MGTPDLYPLENTISDKSLSLLTIRPRFVGLAARPRAATLPHTTSWRRLVRPAKLAAPALFSRGCFAPTAVLAWSAVCAPRTSGAWCSTGGTGSAGGAGRRAPRGGALGGVVEHVPIVLAGAPGYRTRPIPAFGARLRQSGGGKHRNAQDPKTAKNDPERNATSGASQLTIGFCRNESLGGRGGSGAPYKIHIVRIRTGARPAFSSQACARQF